jgi:hypothetical protein
MRKAIWILWPSFIIGGVAGTAFFAFFDPAILHLFEKAVGVGHLAIYSTAFFVFWFLAAASSALTCFLQRSAQELNRCPLVPSERPDGCPKREEPNALS